MPQPPQSYRELETLITAEYATLSKRLQQTARFMLDHPQEVALATVAKIAEQADVTPSTLIRLANSLGFKGFSEMQQLFRSRLVDEFARYAAPPGKHPTAPSCYGSSLTPTVPCLSSFPAALIQRVWRRRWIFLKRLMRFM